ncbi:DUF6247 family protein [Pseudonocardia spinosispora]|uniref:DUF6247 family protein n=1 Tax=Pseudonocardia spinosispora TaxID=103441 RepID=UPI000409574F|nr:DUF6247 family protein [Pseudonocardia spinosispora]
MTAARVDDHSPRGGLRWLLTASPAEVRACLIPEEAAQFDEDWREALMRAVHELDLTEVHAVLDSWRRTAIVTQAKGPDAYRTMLESAARRLRTGERAEGAVPWSEIKARLGL